MKRIVVSVTNDLVTDQRVHKVCSSLINAGYDVTLIGRLLKKSTQINRAYKTKRMRLVFNTGFLFYAEFNIRLFLKLLFLKKDVLVANDLDTLLPNFIISKLSRSKLVYDSHELFTEVPELIHRPAIQKVWLKIEEFIFPKLKNVITVNNVISSIYQKKYNVPVHVIRNIAPALKNKKKNNELSNKIKGTNKLIILQGAGINIDRGAEEAVEMMQYLENTILYIIGSGDVYPTLEKMVLELNLKNKVHLLGRRSYEDLMEFTKISDLGLSLDKNTNLNYEYSLPNKIFDYIQAGIPLLVSNRKIIAEIISKNNIGIVTSSHDPKELAQCVAQVFENQKRYGDWKNNLSKLSTIYNWEHEEEELLNIYDNLQ